VSTQKTVRITLYVDKSLNENANGLFWRLGLDRTVTLNMFLQKAVKKKYQPTNF